MSNISQKKNLQAIQKSTKNTSSTRSNCITVVPTLCSGLNLKGNDEIIVINFLDSVNNRDSNNLITSIALPPTVAKDLYKSLEKAINDQEKE